MPRRQLNRNIGRAQIVQARQLRRDASVAEKVAWQMLRKGQLGFSFRRQHAVGPYILDFYCAEAMLAVEFDGEQHDPGADERRDAWFRERGVETFRIPNPSFFMLKGAEYRDWIADLVRLCEARTGRPANAPPPAPSPTPGVVGEGDPDLNRHT